MKMSYAHPGNPEDIGPGTNRASGKFSTTDGKVVEIRDVWAYNLEEEMEKIREVILKYPFVAMVSSLII